MKFGGRVPFDVVIWRIAFETGWTLEYIEGLDMQRIADYLQIRDAMNKAGL